MTASPLTRDGTLDLIADIFARRGADSYLGEEVTMSAHMLQAARLAEEAGAPDELIAAALLHDIGHYTSAFPEDALEHGIDNRHDLAGAKVLEPCFPPAVTEPIRLHVAAKKYLCTVDPGYFGRLSAASVHTLRLQGGPMTETEAAEFARHPFKDAAVQIRRWDEGAKVKGAPTSPFGHYLPLLKRVRRPDA